MFIKNSEISKNFKLILYSIILLGFLVRILCIVFISAYIGQEDFKFAAEDALNFHFVASWLLEYGLSWGYFGTEHIPSLGFLYSYFLAIVYSITASSVLVGNLLSSLLWLSTALVVNAVMLELNTTKKNQIINILFFCFLPTSILITIFTLREVYQLFFFTTSIYFFIKFYKYHKIQDFIFLIFSTILLALFHKALFIISCAIVYFAILSYFKIQIKSFKFINISLILLGLMTLINIFFFKIEFFELISTTRVNHSIGRATYAYETLAKDVNFATNYLYIVIFYFLKPFPLDVSNFSDLIYMIENVIRAAIIFKIIKYIFFDTKIEKNIDIHICIFLLCILTEVLWSLGTVNWGTALRHHYVVTPILYLLYFNLFFKKNEK